jgi:hypothetical protein
VQTSAQPERLSIVHAYVVGKSLVVAGIVNGQCITTSGWAQALDGPIDIDRYGPDVEYMKALLRSAAAPRGSKPTHLN